MNVGGVNMSIMTANNDAPYLDMERGWEMEAYNLIKNRDFDHTPLYDPALL
jgi:hypothetical protein